ncbi:MAG: hypothetical protein OEM27_03110 [Nitrospinota bacterium]|nr:hypothetical protein [Nitrospinota bacterium]
MVNFLNKYILSRHGPHLTSSPAIWFWLTPIVWFKEMIPHKYQWYLDLNPLAYIVEGYKKSFIYHSPFWEDIPSAMYFWGIGLLAFVLGGLVFKKLKPEFAEAL